MKSKLALQISRQAGMIIFGSMLLYAMVLTDFNADQIDSLFFRHAWHSLAIGILIYLFLQWRLRTVIFRPLQTVLEHGHEMAHGQFRFKHYPQTQNEFDELMHTMNYLSAHLEHSRQTPWTEYANTIDSFLTMIRSREDLPIDVQADLCLVIDNLRNMEWAVSQSLQRNQSTANPDGRLTPPKYSVGSKQNRKRAPSSHASIPRNEDLSCPASNLQQKAECLQTNTTFG